MLRDAVSTPRSYPTDTALGLGDAAPRAVPQDALLAALSPLVDGGVLVKAILLTALWAAGYGAAVLARELLRAPLAAQLVATTVALWNPYIAERLLQGHWSLLTGYAALPWTALAATRLRERRPGAAAALAGCFAAAGLTPTGALLAGVLALALVGRRAFAVAAALLVAACAPWLIATAVSGVGAEPSDPAGITAFAARAEPGLATIGSLAGLGGIWNADAVPVSRTTLLATAATALLLLIVGLGVRAVATGDADAVHTRTRRTLLLIAAIAIMFPAFGATAWGTAALEWLVVHIPGAGLLRDTQKYVALAMPAYALCAAAACRTLASWLDTHRPLLNEADAPARNATPTARIDTNPAVNDPGTGTDPRRAETQHTTSAHHDGSSQPITDGTDTASRPLRADCAGAGPDDEQSACSAGTGTSCAGAAGSGSGGGALVGIAVVLIALLVVPLLDLAWGVGGQVRAVRYPGAWQEVVERIDGPGDIAVLPGGMFRKFPYSGVAPVLDPAPRMLPRDVLQTGELPVRGRIVNGEGARAGRVEDLLLAGGPADELARLGVGWVLVERTTPGPLGDAERTLAQLEPVHTTSELALYRVPGVVSRPSAQHRLLVIAAHLLWGVLLLAPALTLIHRRQSGIR
ncbi:hypothetical protein B0T44_16155 [Nocardia donostiensis]|nr:hypothetical protein B0T36_24670 [Nocardia donostiensis]OQS19078.1 hypothetical protein B0T44_16155 [Nocardia donostiensis]